MLSKFIFVNYLKRVGLCNKKRAFRVNMCSCCTLIDHKKGSYMKKLAIIAASLTLSSSLLATTGIPSNGNETQALVKFLVSNELLGLGNAPTSYYIGTQEDIAKYFGDYVCTMSTESCQVVDHLYTEPFAVLGQGLPPMGGTDEQRRQAQSQIERTDMKYGADIYDSATWQIAVALAAKNNYIPIAKARELIDNQLAIISLPSNRATNTVFKYGYTKTITDPKVAFTFRMIARDTLNTDPFYPGRMKDYVSWDESIRKPELYYKSTWSDWKPIIGENAWAQLLGPLQAELILNNGTKISSNSKALINAMNSLDAFSAMQAGIGGFYYAPGGSLGNQGPIEKGEISLENNFSTLGALQVFKTILDKTEQTSAVIEAKRKVNVMLNGGTTVNNFETVGLISFIYNGSYDKKRGVFYTHGTAVNPSSQNDWKPDTTGSPAGAAVDINTWGTSALGVKNIDTWFGAGTAKRIWQNVRNKGGYFNSQGELWGVGYTLNNNVGLNPEHLMSTEWTAGAINMLESLIEYYPTNETEDLRQDLASMKAGVKNLRNDNYLAAGFDNATPKEYFVTLPETAGQAYLYSSKRAAIPFGWNANTLPSATSNAWILMNTFRFNPFQYNGKLSGEDYPTPQQRDLSGDTPSQGDALPKETTINFNAGDLGSISSLTVSYKLDKSSLDWKIAKIVKGRTGVVVLPQGTQSISMSYDGQYGLCVLEPATKICKDATCTNVFTLVAKWSQDGMTECLKGG